MLPRKPWCVCVFSHSAIRTKKKKRNKISRSGGTRRDASANKEAIRETTKDYIDGEMGLGLGLSLILSETWEPKFSVHTLTDTSRLNPRLYFVDNENSLIYMYVNAVCNIVLP